MEDYIIDQRIPIHLKSQLLEQLKSVQQVEKNEIQNIQTQLQSENYIDIHVGLYKLTKIVCKEYDQEHFPIEFGDEINVEFVQFLINNNIVVLLIRLIQQNISIQCIIDAIQILTCCMNGEQQQAMLVIQNGFIQCLIQLLNSKIELIGFTSLIGVLQSAKQQKYFCKIFLNGYNEQLIFKRYEKEPIFCLKTLFALCTKRPQMKFSQIKKSLLFMCEIILNETSIEILSKTICIITGKWIPLPPLKDKQIQRLQLFLDKNLLERFKILIRKYYKSYELMQIIMTNLIFMLSGNDKQQQYVLDSGIMIDIKKLLDCQDNSTYSRCLYLLRFFSNIQFGVQYLLEQECIVQTLLRRYSDEVIEQNLFLLVDIFKRIIKASNIQFIQNLIDQQIIKIIVKNIKYNFSFDNVTLNCKTLEMLKQLFEKAKKDSQEFSRWRLEFQRVGGTEALQQLSSKAQLLNSMNEFFNF